MDYYDLGSGFGHVVMEVDDAVAACKQIKHRGGKVVREAALLREITRRSPASRL